MVHDKDRAGHNPTAVLNIGAKFSWSVTVVGCNRLIQERSVDGGYRGVAAFCMMCLCCCKKLSLVGHACGAFRVTGKKTILPTIKEPFQI